MAEGYASTTVNIAKALGFFSKMSACNAGDARNRTPIGDSVERGVMATRVTNGPEAHQRMEDCSSGGDGVSRE